MTTISLVANDQLLSVALNPKLASGDVNSVILHVDFSTEWDGYARSAVFFTSNNETPYEKVMTNGECTIQAEVLAESGILFIGVRGVNSDNASVKTSSLVKYKISDGAPAGKGTEVEPTADVYQQLLTAYGKTDARITQEVTDRKAAVATEKAERQAEIAVERERINQFTALEEGSTTGDAELIDARIDYKGTTHDNVGDHIRAVSGQLSEEICDIDTFVGIHKSAHVTLPSPDLVEFFIPSGTTITIYTVDGENFPENRLHLYDSDGKYTDYFGLSSTFGNSRTVTYNKKDVYYIALNVTSNRPIAVKWSEHENLADEVSNLKTEVENINSSNGNEKISDIFVDEMQNTIDAVRECITEPCLVFPRITDIHYSTTSNVFQNFDETVKNMKHLAEFIHLDCVVNNGDNINGSSDISVSLAEADHVTSLFNSIGVPYLFSIGNHDTNYDPSPKFDIGQTYRGFMSATKDVVYNKATNGTDFYKDFDDIGIRMVFINTQYLNAYVINNDTVSWLRDVALDTNHIVVLCSHMSTESNQNFGNKIPTNAEEVSDIITNFISSGGTLIQLFGHSHADYSFTTPWLSIASTCSKFESIDVTTNSMSAITGYVDGIVSPVRTEGTETEQAWDVVIVRPTSRKINLVRFGAGSDREYNF